MATFNFDESKKADAFTLAIGKEIGKNNLNHYFTSNLINWDMGRISRYDREVTTFPEMIDFIRNSGFRYVNGLGHKIRLLFDANVPTADIRYDAKTKTFIIRVGTLYITEEYYKFAAKMAGVRYKRENAVIVALALVNFFIYHETLHHRFSDIIMMINLGQYVVDMTPPKYHNKLFTDILNITEDLFIEHRVLHGGYAYRPEFLSGLIKDAHNFFYTTEYFKDKPDPLNVLDYIEYSRGWYGSSNKHLIGITPEISMAVIEYYGQFLGGASSSYNRMEMSVDIYNFFEELAQENEQIAKEMQEAADSVEEFEEQVEAATKALENGEDMESYGRGSGATEAAEKMLGQLTEAAENGDEVAKAILEGLQKVAEEMVDIDQHYETTEPFDYDGYQPPKHYNGNGKIKYADVTEISERSSFTPVVRENWLATFSQEFQQFLIQAPDYKVPDKRGRLDGSLLHNVFIQGGLYKTRRIEADIKAEPQITVICDVSGSTSGYAKSSKVTKRSNTIFDFIISGAYYISGTLRQSKIGYTIYAHTTDYHADAVVYGVAAYNSRLSPHNQRIVTTANDMERFSYLNAVRKGGNADGDILGFISEFALDNTKENLIIVISDGAPADTVGGSRESAWDRLKSQIAKLRSEGVHVVALTVVENENVINANNELYGKDYNIVATDVNSFIKNVRKVIDKLIGE